MSTFKIGDLVWAKMKGFPQWPGVVVEPHDELKQLRKSNSYCIFFFGSLNYAWIEIKMLSPYNSKDEVTSNRAGFKDAVAAIEHYKLTGEGGPVQSETTDPFDQLIKPSPPPSASSEKKGRKSASKGSEDLSDLDDDSASRPSKPFKVARKSSDTPKVRPLKKSLESSLSAKRKKKTENYAADTTTGESSSHPGTPFRKSLLDRPVFPRPESPTLDITTVSKTLLNKSIIPSDKVFGFLGLGVMGSGIVKNLLNSNHEVYVWDRSPSRSQEFVQVGAKLVQTPSDLAVATDIIFCCVSDSQAARDMVFGNCGVISEMSSSKAYVEMSGIDPETSLTISKGIQESGGRYLEAQLQGSKGECDEGTLIILAAGDRTLYNDVSSCFEAIGRASFFLGDVGCATKMNLLIQMLMGVTLSGLAEAMALANRCGLNLSEVLEVLGLTQLSSPFMIEKGQVMEKCNYATNLALKHLQKDLSLAMSLADSVTQSIPTTATSNEVFKRARRVGYDNYDASAVYIGTRF